MWILGPRGLKWSLDVLKQYQNRKILNQTYVQGDTESFLINNGNNFPVATFLTMFQKEMIKDG